MADPVWTDGVTPLNAANMTKLQTRDEKGAPSGYVGLDSSSGASAAAFTATGVNPGATVYVSKAQGEANWRHYTDASGKHFWGDGTAAPDTNLYRSAAGTLKTDGTLQAAGPMAASQGTTAVVWLGNQGPAGAAGMTFGSAGDTNLYRAAAGQLKTDGLLLAGGAIIASYGTANEVFLSYSGAPQIAFGSARDTNLYRAAAGVLRTDGWIQIGGTHPTTDNYSTLSLWIRGVGQLRVYRDASGFLKC